MKSVDARGKSCPLPIVMTARAIREVGAGEVVTILADDRAFVADIDAWCNKTGNELVSLEEKTGFSEATVRKAG